MIKKDDNNRFKFLGGTLDYFDQSTGAWQRDLSLAAAMLNQSSEGRHKILYNLSDFLPSGGAGSRRFSHCKSGCLCTEQWLFSGRRAGRKF